MTSPSRRPPASRSQKLLSIAVALLGGLSASLGSYIVAKELHASSLDAVGWAGCTFIAVSMLVLRILDELR
ncbi:hypothetical protein ACFXAW_35750 [Streptomyces sp. NPDC059445]|uniref:hypothetical protein n=1 Tax=unclassified Streptomyces TaxID=2593676 RepID=UPI0036B7A8BB